VRSMLGVSKTAESKSASVRVKVVLVKESFLLLLIRLFLLLESKGLATLLAALKETLSFFLEINSIYTS
jgi:hypothetical protein